MKLDFNADEVEVVDDDFSPLPPGNYPVIVESSEFKETRAGNGKFLLLQLMVIDGKGKNRKLFDRLNLENPNPQAVEFAKQQLASLCSAMGKQKIADSAELHDNPIVARVEIQKGSDGYEDSNEVKGYQKYHPSASAAQEVENDNIPF